MSDDFTEGYKMGLYARFEELWERHRDHCERVEGDPDAERLSLGGTDIIRRVESESFEILPSIGRTVAVHKGSNPLWVAALANEFLCAQGV